MDVDSILDRHQSLQKKQNLFSNENTILQSLDFVFFTCIHYFIFLISIYLFIIILFIPFNQ